MSELSNLFFLSKFVRKIRKITQLIFAINSTDLLAAIQQYVMDTHVYR